MSGNLTAGNWTSPAGEAGGSSSGELAAGHLGQLVSDVPHLRGVFVTVMPDCLLFDSWVREDSRWSADKVASYFGDVVRANREGLKAMEAWSADIQLTIEAPDLLIVLKELAHDFVCTCVFERQVALGMVRLHTRRLHERIEAMLPTFAASERPRAVRVTEFLERYAPDPHAVMLRVSLRTGIERSLLTRPNELTAEQAQQIEDAACGILGLAELNL